MFNGSNMLAYVAPNHENIYLIRLPGRILYYPTFAQTAFANYNITICV